MEVCEETMRRIPKCSKHEWRHEGVGRGRGECQWAFVRMSVSVRWAHVRPVGFCPVGFCPPTRLSMSKGKIDSFSISTRTRTFFVGHCFTDVFQSVHD